MLDSYRKVYAAFAVIITGFAVFLFIRISFILYLGKTRREKSVIAPLSKPAVYGWFLLSIPNFLVASVYFIEHFHILITKQNPRKGAWCTCVAFLAIVSMVCLNGSCLTIAYMMHEIVKHGPKNAWRTLLYGNLTSWIIGIGVGLWYLSGNSLGPYRSLYCCISQEYYNGSRIFLIFGFFFFSISAQAFLYYRAFCHISTTGQGARPRPIIFSENGIEHNEVSNAATRFMKKGILFVSIFYTCWFWISVDAIIHFSGQELPLISSIIAALLAKMNSVFHNLLMLNAVERKVKVAADAYMQQS